jgi:hypothetical protein
MDVASGILLLLFKHNMDVFAWLSIVLGALGSLQVYFAYDLAKNRLKMKAKFSYRYSAQNDFSPSALLVQWIRIGGWMACSLPIIFLFFGL